MTTCPATARSSRSRPSDRESAVDLVGETVQGDDLDLADLRGQVVVVNVWGSLVRALPRRDADAGGRRGGAAGRRDRVRRHQHPGRRSTENAAAFERDLGVDYPSIYDPGSVLLDEFGRYTPYAPPTTLVLDREGRVAALVNGPLPSKSTLVTVVEDVLAESADG